MAKSKEHVVLPKDLFSTKKENNDIPKKKFSKGDIVWYAIPENSDPGIVVECIYYESIRTWKYEVTFSKDYENLLYDEVELSFDKRLV